MAKKIKRCKHNRRQSRCIDCGGSEMCKHNRQRYRCRDCKGSGVCEQCRPRHRCKRCKRCRGVAFCEHNRRRYGCSICCPKGAFAQYYHNARKRNIVFEITLEEFKALVLWPCLYCGENDKPRGVDRAENNVGYVYSNCIPCCGVCNHMKSSTNIADFIQQSRRIVEYTLLEGKETS